MAQGGQANITVADSGSATINVAGTSVQLVIGCCSGGTVGQIVATRSPTTLTQNLGYGPLVEAAGLVCAAGGTVICIKAASAVAGTVSTITATAAGTSVMTVTGTPVDTYFVKVLVVNGGTVGTTGCTIQVSLDAGRNYGPVLSLGSATTYALGTTGLTLNFAAGTLIAAGTFTFGTTEPTWNTAGILAALTAFQGSQYAAIGVGSTHIVGVCSGANATTIQGYLDTLAANFIYTRAYITVRDASPPAAWGGTGETEQVWMGAIQTDFSATAARRLCGGAGFYNMPTVFPLSSIAGAPAYRRPLAWAAAARQVTIPTQRHVGRVKDGAVSQVVINPVSDPLDGFVYHNEALNPGLDYLIAGTGGRFMTGMVRAGLPGLYITNPTSLAPLGSDFYLLPYGSVMDTFCSVIHTNGQLIIDDDVRVNPNGTIFENDARNYESQLAFAVNTILYASKMISQPVQAGPTSAAAGATILIDRTVNVKQTNQVVINGQINGRAYVLSAQFTLGFQNPAAAV